MCSAPLLVSLTRERTEVEVLESQCRDFNKSGVLEEEEGQMEVDNLEGLLSSSNVKKIYEKINKQQSQNSRL